MNKRENLGTFLTPQEQKTIDYYETHGDKWSEQHKKKSFWEKELNIFYQMLPTGKIIELGCGYGQDAYYLVKHGYSYVGIDLSEKFLAIARSTNPGVSFLKKSLYNLPFQDSTFDGFWASLVFLHIPKLRIDEAFTCLKQVLKQEAIGFISLKAGIGEEVEEETGRFFAYYDSDDFRLVLERNNFIILRQDHRTEIKRIKEHTWLTFFVKYSPVD